MDDAATLALLRRHVAWGIQPGARVVLREDIVASGADVREVDRFVVANGGRRVDPFPGDHRSTPPHWQLPGETFFRQ